MRMQAGGLRKRIRSGLRVRLDNSEQKDLLNTTNLTGKGHPDHAAACAANRGLLSFFLREGNGCSWLQDPVCPQVVGKQQIFYTEGRRYSKEGNH
ncbi:hypothetical protein BBD40_16720 [Paenibacillus ihbetae]|uniref:Uncharacterized protein n=1 Tax=Paenibacillus ihbetae TaxID=1870820 RepID=A0ABX3K1V0_9BACL|nr:hypothetical protein BBD40_16720 [Paenibacillus ihbetae]